MNRSKLTHGSLFSGVEGFGLGAAFAGIKTLWSCEYEDYQFEIIKKNFGEEHEINRDIRTYQNPPSVDIISGGFPCQDISIAGKGVGVIGEKRFFKWLRDNHYLCALGERYNQPTQKAVEQGLFELRKITINVGDNTKVRTTTKVTGKGQIYFVNKFLYMNQKHIDL